MLQSQDDNLQNAQINNVSNIIFLWGQLRSYGVMVTTVTIMAIFLKRDMRSSRTKTYAKKLVRCKTRGIHDRIKNIRRSRLKIKAKKSESNNKTFRNLHRTKLQKTFPRGKLLYTMFHHQWYFDSVFQDIDFCKLVFTFPTFEGSSRQGTRTI